ncbi:MAG: DUF3160 domain-containing protein [Candidatus Sifarchaeia archaeon]
MFPKFVRYSLDTETRKKMIAGGIASSLLALSLVVTLGVIGGWNLDRYTHTGHPNSPIFTIDFTVSNDFADFAPYSEEFTVNVPWYTISPGLSNVANLNDFPHLTSAQRSSIEVNGFAATPSEYKQIYDILLENKDEDIPSFVSSDAVLHAFHILYDLALRETEVYTFWDLLGNLTLSLVHSSYEQYKAAPDGRWKDSALRNVMFFSVAQYLLDNETVLYPEVINEVNTVLSLIESHSDISDAWFQNYREDFSQYVPRGHYTRTHRLKQFFMAMMWYGRIAFRLQPGSTPLELEKGLNETAQAILMTLALQDDVEGLVSGTKGYTVWEAIYEPTRFFVGDADDLLPKEYGPLIDEVFGTIFSLNDLDDDILLSEFIDSALALRQPLILSSVINDTQNINQTKGLRFMGQRFAPDSYFLGQLVYDNVGTQFIPRTLPKGLDVMAALGSDRAWELLDDQKDYYQYVEQMKFLWESIQNMSASEWTHNLYYLWLYSLLPLLNDPGDGYPMFMQSEAWVDKQLMTSLASWTELRHDTILYAKQSYTVVPTSAGPPVAKIVGYVEPVPRVYARLATLCDMMIEGLAIRNIMSERLLSKLSQLHTFLLDLKRISEKELSGQLLTADEVYLIKNSGLYLEQISSISDFEDLTSAADERMAVIADVHTYPDPENPVVLEEAVGNPMLIYVAVEIEGRIILTRGGIFSYYEFEQPLDNRLTDEAWQAMLVQGTAPAMPLWVGAFVADVELS